MDDRRRIGRCHIPACRDLRQRPLGRDREDELDFAHIGGEADATTDGASLYRQVDAVAGGAPAV